MNEMTQIALIILGTGVCLVLSMVIYKQWRQLQRTKRLEALQREKLATSRVGAADSIKVLARCILAEQVELSEACIRIKVLLDVLDPSMHEQAGLNIFNRIYEATAHMPTHQARKKVDKRFLWKLDKQRWSLEKEHQQEILEGAERLLQHPALK